MFRASLIERNTLETQIKVNLNLDGSGVVNSETKIGFFDHMLILLGKHGFMDMDINASGDLFVDCHHTVEDTGIAIGKAIREALGDKKSIKRYGTAHVPMDEALAMVSLDISDRPYLVFDVSIPDKKIGSFDTEMVEEFFRAVAFNAGITLHAKVLYGKNNHHMVEALFKALGRAISEAVLVDSRIKGVMSTKGVL